MANTIYAGSVASPAATWGPDRIKTINAYLSSAIIGDRLNVDTFSPVLGNGIVIVVGGFIPDEETEPLLTAGGETFQTAEDVDVDPSTLSPGTPLFWYVDGALHGKYYVSSVKRTAKAEWAIEATSAIGLLQKIDHNGGIYEGDTAGSIIADIIGGAFPYTVDSTAAAVPVWGWLPIAKARDNLHKLLTALGINVTKDVNGDPVFRFITAGAATAVPDDRIFLGGSVADAEAPSRVEVTEHQYLPVEDEIELYSGTAGNQLRVTFPEPVHDLQAGGFTVHSSGANFAVISGAGSLRGKKFRHDTTIRSMANHGGSGGTVAMNASNTVVSVVNGYRVLQRLFAYYTAAKTIAADLKVAGELPNTRVSFTDAFGDPQTAWIKTMRLRASTFVRAQTELVAGYNPIHYGNIYQRALRYTGDGSTTLPPDDFHLLVVLIGGGDGGSGGYDGEDGAGSGEMLNGADGSTERWYYNGGLDRGGAGGLPGQPGASGKILAFEIDVPADTEISWSVGEGGTGGSRNGGAGTAGSDTWIEINGVRYSSADGSTAANGVRDVLNGTMYGLPGKAGVPGGDGGYTSLENRWGWRGTGADGGDVPPAVGGAGGAGAESAKLWGYATAAGGGGGGAAYMASGSVGTAGTVTMTSSSSNTIVGGNGGNGVPAALPPASGYGGGGSGGNGGGGGGNAGGGSFRRDISQALYTLAPGSKGTGGTGSKGADGGDGIVLIFLQN